MQRVLKMLGAALLVPAMFFTVNTVAPQEADAQWGRGYHSRSYHRGYNRYRGNYNRGYRYHRGYRNYNRGFYNRGYRGYNRGYWRGPRYGVSTPYGSFFWR